MKCRSRRVATSARSAHAGNDAPVSPSPDPNHPALSRRRPADLTDFAWRTTNKGWTQSGKRHEAAAALREELVILAATFFAARIGNRCSLSTTSPTH